MIDMMMLALPKIYIAVPIMGTVGGKSGLTVQPIQKSAAV
jgi:hypothetical protein